MIAKNNTLKALYSSDLKSFLEKSKLNRDFENGNLKCKYCKQVITQGNLYAFIPNGTGFDICCDSPNCIIELTGGVIK